MEQAEVEVAGGGGGLCGRRPEKAAVESFSFASAGAAADAGGTGKEEEEDGAKAEAGRQEAQGQEA